MNLEGAAASLLEQFPDGLRSELQRQEQSLERFGTFAFTGFGIVLGLGVLGLLYWIFERMIANDTQVLPGILLMAFIIFSALTLAYVVRVEMLKDKRKKLGMLPAPNSLPPATTGKLLEESHYEPATSIIDHTTELLIPRTKPSDENKNS